MKFGNILEAIGNTPLVRMDNLLPTGQINLYGKLEGHNPSGSLKDRIAVRMIGIAEQSGILSKDRIILEPTSGNTGISLAMVCQLKGYRLTCVLPDNVPPERIHLLEMYGVELVLTPGSEGSNGSIRRAKEIAESNPQFLMLYQYGNEANPQAHYEGTASEILNDLPEVDVLVAGLGTGGTLMGCARRLKENNPNTQVIAAEPEYGEKLYGLRNLDEGFIPEILNLDLLDGRVRVDGRSALSGTRALLKEGIFAGISSGAVIHVCRRVAERMEAGNIVAILPDGGWKYLSTGAYSGDFEDAVSRLENTLWA